MSDLKERLDALLLAERECDAERALAALAAAAKNIIDAYGQLSERQAARRAFIKAVS